MKKKRVKRINYLRWCENKGVVLDYSKYSEKLEAELPEDCFAYNIVETSSDDPASILAETGMHFVGGVIYDSSSMELLKEEDPLKHERLLRNMEAYGWTRVVKTKFGFFQPFLEGDKIV